MFTKSLFVTLAALAISVNAQTATICSITAPLQGTQWTAGQTAIISWINPTLANFTQIELEDGNPNALSPVGVLATNVPTAPLSYSFVVPANLPAGTTYALVLGTQPNVCYSPAFSIVASSGTTAAIISGNSSTPATSGAAVTTSTGTALTTVTSVTTSAAVVETPITLAPVSTALLLSTIPSSSSAAASASSTPTKSAAMSNTVHVRTVLGAIGIVGLVMMMF
ncbi:hypothetical protein BC937DRAFT_95027 [Endogone sp. FLAS-F59071]|nr:hypothetical protein BC937DRAFT_95027 [Endogone sp. FLAS-F59071]|eukprot:RUS20519.1 hypothetical protein BC937DRAFT_95027 [Endogone sp. FLAS-F59071]